MDEQMNNNGYQYQPNPSPMPNPNKDGIAIAPQKKGMATAGFITSIIGCVLGAIVLAVCVVAFCTAASVSYSAYKTFF